MIYNSLGIRERSPREAAEFTEMCLAARRDPHSAAYRPESTMIHTTARRSPIVNARPYLDLSILDK